MPHLTRTSASPALDCAWCGHRVDEPDPRRRDCTEDFELRAARLEEALDLVAVCRRTSDPSA